MLAIENLAVNYGPVQALHAVSLRVEPGEIVALIGANGAGKSTLLNAVSGVIPAAMGEIRFEGTDLRRAGPPRTVRGGVVQVPEGRQVFANLSVVDNLRLGAYTRRHGDGAALLAAVFELFPRLRERQTQVAGTLSGGEQQMLAIGRALMAQPRLLLLDEPSMGLAPLVVADILRTLARLNRDLGLSILLVEQNARAALKLSHRAYVLAGGRIVRHDQSARLLSDPEIHRAFLGEARA